MRARLFLASLIILIGVSCSLFAATIRVPQDQPTIQAGVVAAASGDTVSVSPGLYSLNLTIQKSIALLGSAGPKVTVLQPLVQNAPIIQSSNQHLKIIGLTFTGSSASSAVSLIKCYAELTNCIVRNNSCTVAPLEFFGIFDDQVGSCIVDSCLIIENNGGQYAAGILLTDMHESSIIRRSIFRDNVGRHGGGVTLWNASNVSVQRCIFYNNSVDLYGSGVAVVNSSVNDTISNCTLVGNTSFAALGSMFLLNPSNVALNNIVAFGAGPGIVSGSHSFNNSFGNSGADFSDGINQGGNISLDPGLSGWDCIMFSLGPTSSCVDAGNPSSQFFDPDGSRNDIGALPYFHQLGSLSVPSQLPTIQAAVEALWNADTIFVDSGRYVENIDSHGKMFSLVAKPNSGPVVLAPRNTSVPILRFSGCLQKDGDPTFDTLIVIEGISFKLADSATCLEISDEIPFSQVLVRNCSFDSSRVGISSSHRTTVNNCKFSYVSQVAAYLETACSIVQGCEFSNNSGYCVMVDDRYSGDCQTGFQLIGNSFVQNYGVLVDVEDGSFAGSLVASNEFFNNACSSLIKIGSPQTKVRSNHFEHNSLSENLIQISDYQLGSSQHFEQNTVIGNRFTSGEMLSITARKTVSVGNNLIVDNSFDAPGCVICNLTSWNSRFLITKNLVISNSNAFGIQQDSIFGYPGSFVVIDNDSWNNELGNFGGDVDSTLNLSTNPLFCDATNGNFLLAAQSPAIGIGPNGIGCVALPELELVSIEDQERLHVLTAQPKIVWHSSDMLNATQSAFEIAVGTNPDWQFAEMWNPATFTSPDTFVVYNGAPLVDGQTYYLRLRVSNNFGWSDWAETTFRMNSLPTIPDLVSPASGTAANTTQPLLAINNASDAEGDSLFYTFEIANDSAMTIPHAIIKKQDPAATTSVMVDIVLVENAKYFWQVKASDYYEESAHSTVRSFYVNASNSAPNQFNLTAPANLYTPPLATKTPTLQWTQSIDPDPFDAVSYSLHLALDSNFSFAHITPAITGTQFVIVNPLTWGTRYWWRVKAIDLNSGETWSSQTFQFRTMKVGDNDANGIINITDIVYIINYIFASGPLPIPPQAGDVNCDDRFNITDAVYMINYIFADGLQPCDNE